MSSHKSQPLTTAPPRVQRWRWLRYVALATSHLYLRHSLPQIEGELTLPGLTAPVTVYRDDRGVPHIEAKNSRDLFRAQGFVTAQDRLWQMELSRRMSTGRLAELFGAELLANDQYFRTLMLRKAAEDSWGVLSPWVREAVEAYVAGVNAYREQSIRNGTLPPELRLVRLVPDPWTPVDTLLVGKFLAYDLGGDWPAEVFRYLLREKVGDELMRQVLPVYPSDGATIMGTMSAGARESSLVELPKDSSRVDVSGLLRAAVIPPEFLGSNNWVLSGKLTASGKPLLANDPHLKMRTPAVWYETHLVVTGEEERYQVIGVSFPGAPGIVIGHNDTIAWGVTNADADVQDLYIERRNPQNRYQFEFRGRWEDAEVHRESIPVKGQADVPFEVVVTRHGPIVSEVAGEPGARPTEALALKWTAHVPSAELEAILSFAKATNWENFREALRKYETPAQNFVFASTDGTIAYRVGGTIPIRAKGKGLVPVPGWTGEYEWVGAIPFDELPEMVNPPQGFIVTANNRIAGDGYPYLIANSWAPPYRAERITAMLQAKSNLTVDDMRVMQGDLTNPEARKALPMLLDALDESALSETEQSAVALLRSWDHVDRTDQAAPLIYHLWWWQLGVQLFEPMMGDLFPIQSDRRLVLFEMVRAASRGEPSDWVTQAGGICQLSTQSFKQTVAQVVSLQGENSQKWSWGLFHRLGPQHALGEQNAVLGLLFDVKEHGVGGSRETVGAMAHSPDGRVLVGASWRMVADLADLSRSRSVLTPGQSGHPLSKWYQNQVEDHLTGQLSPMIYDPEEYRKGSQLRLFP